jgi:DNA-binding transcriptional MocR family regulator
VTWRPELPPGDALHTRLVAALNRDIEAGVLRPGDRLPPQRSLAERLRMSVGTVTKAFQEAERLGLVSGQVGRGTFVKGPGVNGATGHAAGEAATDRVIDLSVNVTPYAAASACFAETMRLLARRPDFHELLAYAPPAGVESHRKAAAIWLARTARFAALDASRLVMTGGGQQAMSLAFSVLCRPGDVILCEAATYYGMKALADHAGYVLHGVAMDEEGICPDALDRAARQTGARAAYLMPTVQVPTARTMGPQRRADILRVARDRKLPIVEDDHYALFAPPNRAGLVPLSQLAPDLCFYIASVSKTLAPGLRTGFLVAPTAADFDRIVHVLRSTAYANASFGSLVMTRWVEDGSAFAIADAMVREVTARWQLATAILDGANTRRFPLSPHLWLAFDELETERTAGRAQRAGVKVTPPELPLLDSKLISGLRICLGTPAARAELVLGLERLRRAVAGTAEIPSGAVI